MPKILTRQEVTKQSKSIAVALVEPEFTINVGYVGRVMANFGLSQLIIVGRDGFSATKLEEAERFASHGSYVLERSKNFSSFAELRKKFKFILGTTAIRGRRKGNLTRKTLDVKECARRVTRLIDLGKSNQLCIVLGRDTTGLTNEELQQCDFTATIDTGTPYNTLNLSHALSILLYVFREQVQELSRRDRNGKRSVQGGKGTSQRKERDRVMRLFEQLALSSDFQKFKRGKLRETLSRLLGRSDPSLRELYLLMGLASKANSKIIRLSSMASLPKRDKDL